MTVAASTASTARTGRLRRKTVFENAIPPGTLKKDGAKK